MPLGPSQPALLGNLGANTADSSAIDRMRLPTICVSDPITPVTMIGVFPVSTPSEPATGADAPCGIG